MPGNETRLEPWQTVINVLFGTTNSRAVASNSNAKSYADTWPGSLAGWLALPGPAALRLPGCQAIRVLRRGGCVALRW